MMDPAALGPQFQHFLHRCFLELWITLSTHYITPSVSSIHLGTIIGFQWRAKACSLMVIPCLKLLSVSALDYRANSLVLFFSVNLSLCFYFSPPVITFLLGRATPVCSYLLYWLTWWNYRILVSKNEFSSLSRALIAWVHETDKFASQDF